MDNCGNTTATTLYVSDLDGTLLNSSTRLSSTTIELLNQAIGHGAAFTVATARTPATVTNLLSQVHSRLPMIVLAGAAMWDNARELYTDVQVIAPDTVCTIADIFERHGMHPIVYRQHGSMLHAHHSGELSAPEQKFVDERMGLRLKRFILDDDEQAYRDPADGDALLMFSMHDYDRLGPVYREVKDSTDCSVMYYRDIFDRNAGMVEIYKAGCTKASAIRRLAERIGASRTVVFGDNGNDLPMMRAATHSVAVGNAIPEVKEAAHEVIGINDDDSVARWIVDDLKRQGLWKEEASHPSKKKTADHEESEHTQDI